MNLEALKEELTLDEGLKLSPYRDTVGKLTIGVGHNLDDRPITKRAAQTILEDDIADVIADLSNRLPWWTGMNDTRQRVLANLCFNLGINRLLGFKKALAAMQAGDYSKASDELWNSAWAGQVGQRATRLCVMMRDG